MLPAGVLQQFEVTLGGDCRIDSQPVPSTINPKTGFVTVDDTIGGRAYSVVVDAGSGGSSAGRHRYNHERGEKCGTADDCLRTGTNITMIASQCWYAGDHATIASICRSASVISKSLIATLIASSAVRALTRSRYSAFLRMSTMRHSGSGFAAMIPEINNQRTAAVPCGRRLRFGLYQPWGGSSTIRNRSLAISSNCRLRSGSSISRARLSASCASRGIPQTWMPLRPAVCEI